MSDKERTELERLVVGIAKKSRSEEIAVTFHNNGDIRPHRLDARKSGISELNINHIDNASHTVTSNHAPKIYIKGSDSLAEYNEPLTKSDVQYDFTFAELFAGIGGVSFGFEAVGGKCVLAAEYDPTAEGKRQFAQDAYKALHPGTPVVGDVFKLDAKDVPDCDVLSFTTPCQSFSVAGKRLGFEDTRGTLVFEALRIAKEKRPKALFMENVKGLVNHDKGRTIDTILHAMNEVGYTVDFNVLNSKYFGVPQNRERVFIIALRDDLIEPTEWNPVGNTMLPKAKRRLKEAGLRTFNFDWPEQDSVTKRLRDVLEAQVDEKYYLSEEKTAKLVTELEAKNPNERMSRQAVETFNTVCTPVGHGDMIQAFKRQHITDGICPTLTTRPEGFKTAALPIVNGLPIREATTKGYAVAVEGDAVNIQFPNSKTRRGRVGTQMANTLEASGCNQGVVIKQSDIQMVGRADIAGHDYNKRIYGVDGISRTLNTASDIGRSVKIAEPTTRKIAGLYGDRQAGSMWDVDGLAPTIKTSSGGYSEPLIGEYPRYRIRKLTPRECMRLQGFPESATDTLYAEGFSDSRIYKFAGNAVTTTVIKALGERLVAYLDESEAK